MFDFIWKKLKRGSGGATTATKLDSIRYIAAVELGKILPGAQPTDFEFPKNLVNGDLSFFIKDKAIDPTKLDLSKIQHEYIEKAVVVGRFINFFLSKKFFASTLAQISMNPAGFGRNTDLAGKKIIVEYTDPNLFKEFHIGHLMSNSIGESLARIFEWSGATVTRANYQSDVGPNVAKAIWGMMMLKSEMPSGHLSLSEKVAFLGKSYVLGSNAYEDNPESKKQIDAINKSVYQKTDKEINKLYDWGRKASLDHFETIYKKLGTKFDLYFYESEVAPLGVFVAQELLTKGVLEKSEGAVIFRGEKFGLHTRVFINSQGLPTYETKELGLTKTKFDRKDFDQSVVITASEQADYFNVLLKVLEFVDHRAANRTRHISHGMMRFAEGKMSSRKGNVITGESLIGDVEKLVQEKIQDRNLDPEEKAVISEQVAIGAVKYSILKQSPGKDIIFDFAKSLSFEGDSGPYIQYTHARICSVLKKAEAAGLKPSLDMAENPGELEHLLARMSEVIDRAQKELAPQLILTYLINLASAFNHYYAGNVIVDEKSLQTPYRLALTQAVRHALKNGLHLLGIKAPEKM